MTIDVSFVPKLAKKARLRFDRHEARWMILYPERGLALNATGAAIAQKIDGVSSIAAIVDALAREYDATPDAQRTIEADVVAFVTDLRDKGLLEG